MTELEKMLAGELYAWDDPELMQIWHSGKNLARRFNGLDYADKAEQARILDALLGSRGKNTQITAPFYVDYGRFIHLGDNCEINMNCVFLDCNTIRMGNNVLIAPGVHIYTVFHPVRAEERFPPLGGEGSARSPYAVSRTAPVTIGDNVWIGGGSIILPGVSIGSNVTVGAGSLVSRSLPDNVLALGSPCRVVRQL